LFFQLLSLSEIERREASTRPSLGWVAVRKKNEKKMGKNPGGRGPFFHRAKAQDSLERADRAACHRPTRTRTLSPKRY
jgi:hypothetical protein